MISNADMMKKMDLGVTDIDRKWHSGKSDEEIFLKDYWLGDDQQRPELTLFNLAVELLLERDRLRKTLCSGEKDAKDGSSR